MENNMPPETTVVAEPPTSQEAAAPQVNPPLREEDMTAEMLIGELDISHLVTEDDTPVDNLFSEKQQRLLTEPLYTNWRGGARARNFLVAANVGLFPDIGGNSVVPDVFLSMDVAIADDWYARRHRTYFFWEFGKAPEIVIEIVSNREGGEDTRKLAQYARMGIDHYVIFDPTLALSGQMLRVYERRAQQFELVETAWFRGVELGVTLWEGMYEGKSATWLRWFDHDHVLIPTGAESTILAEERAAYAAERAASAEERAAFAIQQAEAEATARRAAEQEMARLRAELERLRGQP